MSTLRPRHAVSRIRAAAARPRRAHLVGLLTFASGGVDAVTLMVLGGAFTSVITGNLIFFGRAVGTSSPGLALHSVLAVGGYVTGVAVGSALAHRGEPPVPAAGWPRRATVVLAAECVVLLTVNVAWVGYHARPPAPAVDLLLVATALALGMQGAAARAIAGTPSTTYMTGALTVLVEALSTGRRQGVDASAVVGLLTLMVGAACGALLVTYARPCALLPPLVAVALVVLVKSRHHRGERSSAQGPGTAS